MKFVLILGEVTLHNPTNKSPHDGHGLSHASCVADCVFDSGRVAIPECDKLVAGFDDQPIAVMVWMPVRLVVRQKHLYVNSVVPRPLLGQGVGTARAA